MYLIDIWSCMCKFDGQKCLMSNAWWICFLLIFFVKPSNYLDRVWASYNLFVQTLFFQCCRIDKIYCIITKGCVWFWWLELFESSKVQNRCSSEHNSHSHAHRAILHHIQNSIHTMYSSHTHCTAAAHTFTRCTHTPKQKHKNMTSHPWHVYIIMAPSKDEKKNSGADWCVPGFARTMES